MLKKIVLLSLFLLASQVNAAQRDPYKFFFNETWGDFKEELANAKAQGKKGLLIFFEMDECPFCQIGRASCRERGCLYV